MKEYIRKADIILFIVLVAAGLAASAFLAVSRADAGSGAKVVIESGGELFAEYPLSKDTEIIVPAPSGVSYRDPKAAPADAGVTGTFGTVEVSADAGADTCGTSAGTGGM